MQGRARGIRGFVVLGIVVWCGVAALPQPGRSSCAPPEQDCACTTARELSQLPDAQIIRAEVLEVSSLGGVFRVLALEGGTSTTLSVGDEVALSLQRTQCAQVAQPLEVGEEVWGAVIDSPLTSDFSAAIVAIRWQDGMIHFESASPGLQDPSPLPEDQRDLLLNYGACQRTFGDQSPPCDDTVDNTDIFCSISSLGGR